MRHIQLKVSHLLLSALLVGALLVALPSDATPAESALGSNGVIYTLSQGSYGELFPQGTEASPDAPVLALQVDRGEGDYEQLLVPGTGGDETEVSASLVVERSSDTVYLVWQSWYSVLHSRLFLSGLTPDGWIDPIEISSQPYAIVSSPRLAVTRDVYEMDGPQGAVSYQRTVLHLVWVEEGAVEKQILYMPVFLVDGLHVATETITDLSALIPMPDGGPGAGSNEDLLSSLTLRSNNESHSVTLAFADSKTEQLISMELRVVPGELTAIANELADYLGDSLGADRPLDQPTLQSIADKSRGHLIDIGYRIHPALLDHLASETRDYIASQPAGTTVSSIIGGSRGHLIDIGVSFDRPGLRKIIGDERGHLIDIGVVGGGRPGPGGLAEHQVEAQVVARYGIPATGPQPDLFVSPDGEQILVAWKAGNGARLLYRESNDETWGEVNSLAVGQNLPLEEAWRLLAQRVEDR